MLGHHVQVTLAHRVDDGGPAPVEEVRPAASDLASLSLSLSTGEVVGGTAGVVAGDQ